MPRAKAVNDEIKPKRATSSRMSRRVSASATATTTLKRKAPTVIPASNRHFSAKSLLITLSLLIVVMAGSAFVGMADNGPINVSGVIQERGQTLRDEGRTEEANQLTIPKDDGTRQPNGGLRPQMGGGDTAPTPAPATLGVEDSTEEATSTDTTTTETSMDTATATESIEPETPVEGEAASSI